MDFCRIPSQSEQQVLSMIVANNLEKWLDCGQEMPKRLPTINGNQTFLHSAYLYTHTHTDIHVCYQCVCAYLYIRPEAAYSGRQCQFESVPRKPERRFAPVRHVNCKLQLNPSLPTLRYIQEAFALSPAKSRYIVICLCVLLPSIRYIGVCDDQFELRLYLADKWK